MTGAVKKGNGAPWVNRRKHACREIRRGRGTIGKSFSGIGIAGYNRPLAILGSAPTSTRLQATVAWSLRSFSNGSILVTMWLGIEDSWRGRIPFKLIFFVLGGSERGFWRVWSCFTVFPGTRMYLQILQT